MLTHVEAIEFQPNVYGLQDTARSNVICVQQLPRLYAPNIFVPEGVNKNFAVKGTYILPLGYTMTVYNRWGDVVFKTNDIDQGWNGYLDNGVEECQMGIYVWKAEFLGTDGNIYSQKGTVQLVR